ncbi:leucine--tRNA ligase [bacterium]|nr:leucine--tRNA ligase [bacterium]RQV98209.1 MAG: leucine--tRNA ligase [bacterium]
MSDYDFKNIEKKWQARWESQKLYETDMSDVERKLYCLVMFLYPSGDRLHIGHWWNYGPTDTWARFKRMQGYNVFEPMGYDAFGLPAENYAIKMGIHPAESTAANIKNIRKQLTAMGAMYDWTKEINTSSPEYYRWTQWFFLLLYKHGLAYKKKAPVNWCPSCKTVLANEQVINGCCERCDSEVYQKDLEQWFFKITQYADRLLEGLDRIDWPEKTKIMQRNWIGRSEGASVRFPLADRDGHIEVFTTRPDTLWGVTYMVLAPEHPMVIELTTSECRSAVEDYIRETKKLTEIDRTSTEKEKTGVFIGSYCINPVNSQKVPIWIADYALASYGTGAVMAVPGHDERDFAFATRFKLPILEVISPDGQPHDQLNAAYVEPGMMIHSGPFTGQASEPGISKVIDYLEEKGWGGRQINYKLRDWLVSRQRYWGAPIPVITCEDCGIVSVPEDQLPVELPLKVDFTGSGESPLLTNAEWVTVPCPTCGKPARREVDTMDTFVCSSWYFLRFPNPQLDTAAFNPAIIDQWLPVDQYVGGAEHAVMHLLYARFFTKVLHDLGYIKFDEPFTRLVHQGVITNNGAKMSKSRGNVINPDDYIVEYGSDVFRMYLMFMGAYTEGGDWSDAGIHGLNRFVLRVWRLVHQILDDPPAGDETEHIGELERICHYSIKMVTQDLQRFQFNTSISRMMELVNAMYLYVQDVSKNSQNQAVLSSVLKTLVQLLAPFAPHLSEELWEKTGEKESVFNSAWPEWDEAKLKTDTLNMVVQINGKVRSQMQVPVDANDDTVEKMALDDQKIQKWIQGKTIVKIVVVKNKLVSVVVK